MAFLGNYMGKLRKNFFIGVRAQALSLGLIDDVTWDKCIADMYRATEQGGTFAYTFFRGTAIV